MQINATHPLFPIASLVAGVFLLIAPRVVSFAASVYLIFVGLLGLNGIYSARVGVGTGRRFTLVRARGGAP